MSKQKPTPDSLALPFWAEDDVAFKKLSSTQKQEIRQIVCPLYQRLVRQPDDPLECSSGLSVIHLIWSELLKQCELAPLHYSDAQYSESHRSQQFAELFRLLDAKCQQSSLLIRLRQNPLKPLPAADTNHYEFPLEAALLPPPIPEAIA